MITVYGNPGCSKCFITKQKLDKARIEYEYIDMWELPAEEVSEIADKYGTELPIIIRDGEKIELEDVM